VSEKNCYFNISTDNHISQRLQYLTTPHILLIDEALGAIGEYGKVHLKVVKGRLRFLTVLTSHDTLKVQPGEVSPNMYQMKHWA